MVVDVGGRVAAQTTLSNQIWTVPNMVSYARVVVLLPLVLACIASEHYGWAIAAAVTLGATDWVDGYLARRLDQRSVLGTELDPVADRLSIALIAVAMSMTGLMPWVFLAIIFGVDAVLFILSLAWFKGYPETEVTMIGKVRTAILLAGIPLLLIAAAVDSETLRTIALSLLTLGVIGHVLAGIKYVLQMIAARQRRSQETA